MFDSAGHQEQIQAIMLDNDIDYYEHKKLNLCEAQSYMSSEMMVAKKTGGLNMEINSTICTVDKLRTITVKFMPILLAIILKALELV